jgi:hypothetical protein
MAQWRQVYLTVPGDESSNNAPKINPDSIELTDDQGVVWSVPNDLGNRHWNEYQEFLAQGGQPLPPVQ